jgi:hypothetical protein
MVPSGCPETSVNSYQRFVTSQKSEGFIYIVAEAWNHARWLATTCILCRVTVLVTKWLVPSRDTVLSYLARTKSQNVTFSVNTVSHVTIAFVCLHTPEVSNALPAGHLRLASSFYRVLSQILFQLCNVARVSVEDFLISDYFYIFSSGTKCLLSMDGNLQLRQQTYTMH